jgi:hypothetical protein
VPRFLMPGDTIHPPIVLQALDLGPHQAIQGLAVGAIGVALQELQQRPAIALKVGPVIGEDAGDP